MSLNSNEIPSEESTQEQVAIKKPMSKEEDSIVDERLRSLKEQSDQLAQQEYEERVEMDKIVDERLKPIRQDVLAVAREKDASDYEEVKRREALETKLNTETKQ